MAWQKESNPSAAASASVRLLRREVGVRFDALFRTSAGLRIDSSASRRFAGSAGRASYCEDVGENTAFTGEECCAVVGVEGDPGISAAGSQPVCSASDPPENRGSAASSKHAKARAMVRRLKKQ